MKVIEQSPDFADDRNPPVPDQSTEPEFHFRRNRMLPVLYIAIDTSAPTNSSNNVNRIEWSEILGDFFLDTLNLLGFLFFSANGIERILFHVTL